MGLEDRVLCDWNKDTYGPYQQGWGHRHFGLTIVLGMVFDVVVLNSWQLLVLAAVAGSCWCCGVGVWGDCVASRCVVLSSACAAPTAKTFLPRSFRYPGCAATTQTQNDRPTGRRKQGGDRQRDVCWVQVRVPTMDIGDDLGEMVRDTLEDSAYNMARNEDGLNPYDELQLPPADRAVKFMEQRRLGRPVLRQWKTHCQITHICTSIRNTQIIWSSYSDGA